MRYRRIDPVYSPVAQRIDKSCTVEWWTATVFHGRHDVLAAAGVTTAVGGVLLAFHWRFFDNYFSS